MFETAALSVQVCDFRYAEIEEHTLPCLIELTETFSVPAASCIGACRLFCCTSLYCAHSGEEEDKMLPATQCPLTLQPRRFHGSGPGWAC